MRRDLASAWPWLLVALALAARIGFALGSGIDPLSASDDAKAYHDVAVNVVSGHGFVTTLDPPHRLDVAYATRPPLTPLTLALGYAVFGPKVVIAQLVLALVGAFGVLGVYLLARELFSASVAGVSGLLAALHPFFLFLAAVPLTETLAITLYTWIALALLRLRASPTPARAIVAGVLLGLASLNRPQLLGFVPFVIVWAWLALDTDRRRALGTALLVLLAWGLCLAPWTARNYGLFHRVIPVSLQAGSTLYQGNNPYAEVPLRRLREGARGWYNDPRWGEPIEGLAPLEADRRALRLALDYIRAHPGAFVSYAAQKEAIFWSAYDHPVHRLSWYAVAALGVTGLVLTRRRWRDLLGVHLLIVETALVAMVFTSMPRFRAPVEPFLLVLAAVTVVQLWPWPAPAWWPAERLRCASS